MVRDEESLSLHRYISFDVGASNTTIPRLSHGWAFGETDPKHLTEALSAERTRQVDTNSAEAQAEALVDWMKRAADGCLPKRHSANGRRPVPWWNHNIDSLRNVLTLDVRNAFNSAPWHHILSAARARSVPAGLLRILEAYLSDRTIETTTVEGETRRRDINCGVPQGSVLGPDLWNLLYDDLMKLALPPDVQIIAFADDVVVISTASVPFILEEQLGQSYQDIDTWMVEHGLLLAVEKTEAIVLTRRRVNTQITVRCNVFDIRSKESIGYLGVQVDQKMGFTDHANIVSKRTAIAARNLGHLMPIVRGPRQKARK